MRIYIQCKWCDMHACSLKSRCRGGGRRRQKCTTTAPTQWRGKAPLKSSWCHIPSWGFFRFLCGGKKQVSRYTEKNTSTTYSLPTIPSHLSLQPLSKRILGNYHLSMCVHFCNTMSTVGCHARIPFLKKVASFLSHSPMMRKTVQSMPWIWSLSAPVPIITTNGVMWFGKVQKDCSN